MPWTVLFLAACLQGKLLFVENRQEMRESFKLTDQVQ
jgi:hypothetical protein